MMAMEEKYFKKHLSVSVSWYFLIFVKINAFHGGIGGETWDEVQIWVIEFVCLPQFHTPSWAKKFEDKVNMATLFHWHTVRRYCTATLG